MVTPITFRSPVTAALAAVVLLLHPGCNWNDCLQGEGEVTTTPLSVPPFERIVVQGPIDVRVRTGEPQRVELEGQANLVNTVATMVSNGTWTITTERCIRSRKPLVVHITAPELTGIRVQGSGHVQSDGTIETEGIELRVQGSGDMQLDLRADRVQAVVQGSGDMLLTGSTTALEATVQGSGDLRAAAMQAREAQATIAGSGDIQVFSTGFLRASITGSGDIRHVGQPDQLEKHITGSGTIAQIP
jgi:hypothetical protein